MPGIQHMTTHYHYKEVAYTYTTVAIIPTSVTLEIDSDPHEATREVFSEAVKQRESEP